MITNLTTALSKAHEPATYMLRLLRIANALGINKALCDGVTPTDTEIELLARECGPTVLLGRWHDSVALAGRGRLLELDGTLKYQIQPDDGKAIAHPLPRVYALQNGLSSLSDIGYAAWARRLLFDAGLLSITQPVFPTPKHGLALIANNSESLWRDICTVCRGIALLCGLSTGYRQFVMFRGQFAVAWCGQQLDSERIEACIDYGLKKGLLEYQKICTSRGNHLSAFRPRPPVNNDLGVHPDDLYAFFSFQTA